MKDLRKEKGWKASDLSRESGVSKKMISELEGGQKTYFKELKHKKAIAEAFGLSIEEFDAKTGGG